MSYKLGNRVRCTSTGTGTGALTLIAPSTGFQSFSTEVGDTNTCPYLIDDGAGLWETGIGTVATAGPTLTRTTVLNGSSGAGVAVSFTAGTKTVSLELDKSLIPFMDNSGNCYIGSTGGNAALYGQKTTGTLTLGPVSGLSYIILDGSSGTGRITTSITSFEGVSTTASAANAVLNNGSSPANSLLRSTSSGAYKHDVQDLDPESATEILDLLRATTHLSNAAADDPTKRFFGLIAEEAATAAPGLVTYARLSNLAIDDPRVMAHASADKIDLARTFAALVQVENEAGVLVDQPTEVVARTYGEFLERSGLDVPADLVPDGVQYDRICVLLLAERAQLRADIADLKAKVGL
jgi:hypothetical protein